MGFAQQFQALADMGVARVKFARSLIGIERVLDLIVARLVEGTEVIPYFANVRVQSDGTAVRVKCISVLRHSETQSSLFFLHGLFCLHT